MREQVLLLGNGTNDVTNHYKWSDLVTDLIDYLGVKGIRRDTEKPFPLLYEEIYLTNLKSKGVTEHEIKSFIAKKLRDVEPNSVHHRIRLLGFSDILTSNYDYSIENASGPDAKEIKNVGKVVEDVYSVFRHTRIDKTNIWHIHGEINSPRSILLGYEQYSGQLQHIRNYVVSGTSNQYKQFESPSLISLMKKGKVENNSWLDLFFLKDVHIIGLTLKFVELDLWWLITYRARRVLERKFGIENRITYYFPGKYEDSMRSELEMFKANEISVKVVGKDHNEYYYSEVLDQIQRQIR